MIEFQDKPVESIQFPASERKVLIKHCIRKLNGDYEQDELPEPKAYGLIGGKVENGLLTIDSVNPLRKNVRPQEPHKTFMDTILNEHAVPSVTPLEQRGWVADPMELRSILRDFEQRNVELVASYHMHRVSWKSDSLRDMPTSLDTILAKDSEIFMFIISVVDPEEPIVRAFYQGECDLEVPIN